MTGVKNDTQRKRIKRNVLVCLPPLISFGCGVLITQNVILKHNTEAQLCAAASSVLPSSSSSFSSFGDLFTTSLVESLMLATTTTTPDDSNQQQQQKQSRQQRHTVRTKIPLSELTQTHIETSCPEGFSLVTDRVLNQRTRQDATTRNIPKIIHITSKSRCISNSLVRLADRWKGFQDLEFYFHNDAALNRLVLDQDWPEFPLLKSAVICMNSMVERTDLWRALVLYEYGGIYTDLDNAPRKWNASSVVDNDDIEAFFEQELNGFLSQYFMASAPRHPIMYMLVQSILQRVYSLPDVHFQYAPFITGPGALKKAGVNFMGAQHWVVNAKWRIERELVSAFWKTNPGNYTGLANWTLTVAPKGTIQRDAIKKKAQIFASMKMTGYLGTDGRPETNESCLHRLYEREYYP